MTIEEYLTDVTKIYYQVSVIIKGRQLLVDGTVHRSTDLLDCNGKLSNVRFSNLLLPADTKVEDEKGKGRDHRIINFGDTRLVIWPIIRMVK